MFFTYLFLDGSVVRYLALTDILSMCFASFLMYTCSQRAMLTQATVCVGVAYEGKRMHALLARVHALV